MEYYKDLFLAFCKVEKGLSSATIEAYARDLQQLMEFFNSHSITDPRSVDHKILENDNHQNWRENLNEVEPGEVIETLADRNVIPVIESEINLANQTSENLLGRKFE